LAVAQTKQVPVNDKSLESWILGRRLLDPWREGRAEVQTIHSPAHLPKRPCDKFDDELNRIAQEVGSRAKAFKLVKHDKKLVHFYLPLEPKNPDDTVWSVMRTISDKIGQQLTTRVRTIADANPAQGNHR